MSVVSKKEREVRQSIREFFDSAAKQSSEKKVCPECGDEMKGITAMFSLSGTDLNWTIALPMCDCSAQGNIRKAA
ncbi:MAG: hypothetical protein WAM79_03335 [Candidatus Sulfotelmatobacter sp.]